MAYLFLRCFALLYFVDTVGFFVFCLLFFYQLKVCGSSVLSKSIRMIFPTVFAQFVTLCHILEILVVFQTLFIIILVMIIWDQ